MEEFLPHIVLCCGQQWWIMLPAQFHVLFMFRVSENCRWPDASTEGWALCFALYTASDVARGIFLLLSVCVGVGLGG